MHPARHYTARRPQPCGLGKSGRLGLIIGLRSDLVRMLGIQEDEERPHAATAADLRALHAASAESPERAAAQRWCWMLNGGKLPALDSMSEVGVTVVSAVYP